MQHYTIKNKTGLKAIIAGESARLISLWVPDKQGRFIDVVLNFEEPSEYCLWDAMQPDEHTIELKYSSKNSNNYSGATFNIKVVYSLNDHDCLKITVEAISNNLQHLNPIDHILFNLNGKKNDSVLKHQLCIRADGYLPIDASLIPIDQVAPVAGSPFDFRKSAIIGSRINDHHQHLNKKKGYCHSFVLNRPGLRTPVAKLRGDKSGIIMEMFTDQPQLHVCSGQPNQKCGDCPVGNKENHGSAVAMVAGDFHQSLHLSQFPLLVIKPGQAYKSVCSFLFKN